MMCYYLNVHFQGQRVNYKKGDKTDCCNYSDISLLITTLIILSSNLLSRLIPYAEESLGIINVDIEGRDQLLIIYSVFAKNFRKNGNTMT